MSHQPETNQAEFNEQTLEQAEGVSHARQTIAQARDRVRDSILKFSTSGIYGNTILVPFVESNPHPHVTVYESLDSYRSFVAEDYLRDAPRELWEMEIDTIPVPTAIVGEEEPATIDLYDKPKNRYGRPQAPTEYEVSLSDLDVKEYSFGLANLEWFNEKYLTVELLGEKTYGGRERDTREFRIVPPMHDIKLAFRQLNSLYARLGEGIQPPNNEKKEAVLKYEWIEDKLTGDQDDA